VEDFLARLKERASIASLTCGVAPLASQGLLEDRALRRARRNNIEYVHLRQAGNPYRDQKDDITTCLALYSKHSTSTPK